MIVRPYHMRWVVSHKRKRDENGELRNLFYGYLQEPIPKGTSTPEGFYHNEPVHDTLEDRYYARQGMHRPEKK